jgi:hypothetical protein
MEIAAITRLRRNILHEYYSNAVHCFLFMPQQLLLFV